MSEHRARYKNTALNPDELRRRREEDSVQLRKQKRDEFISKRRTITQTETVEDLADASSSENFADPGDALTPQTLDELRSTDLNIIIESARRLRKCLSKEPDPPFDEVIEAGIIPRLVELLDFHHAPLIQFEVAWILTNISSSITEHTRIVASSGAVPKLIKLMESSDAKLQEQAVWALGNIIGDGTDLRDGVISFGFIPLLLERIRPDIDVTFLRNLAWVVVNLCRYKDPPVDLQVVRQLIPKIKLLLTVNDEKVLIDAVWAVSYIIELGAEYLDLVLDDDLIRQMIVSLDGTEPRLVTATVRAFGAMAAGTDEQTQTLINAGVLPILSKILQSNDPKVVKDILWLISNVAAGTSEQAQAMVDAGFLNPLIHYLRVGDFLQQKEATWAIFNLSITGNEQQIDAMIQEGVVPALCDLLTLKDPSILKKSLESLKNLLKKSDDKIITQQIESCGGLDKIEALQNTPNHEIYELAYEIIDNYFFHEEID